VSSRPRTGLRKINTSLEIGASWIKYRKSIPFWDIRAGLGCSKRHEDDAGNEEISCWT